MVELAQAAGLVLDPWQVAVLEDGLGERADGKWAALEVALVVPRQNGKGSILEALELAGLFLFGERLILHSAHEFKTASEAFRRIWGLIESTSDLDRLVYRKLQNNNDMSIELKSGQRLRFVARSTGSGRGFSGDRVILDEAYKLPDRAIAALAPTLSARPNPQIWYTSSAPLPNEDSDVLRRICKRGREGESRLAYIEYAAAPDADLDDRDEWRAANPALGVVRADGGGISEEWIASVERGLYTDEDFARERLGIWREDETSSLIDLMTWNLAEDVRSKPLDPVRLAVEISEDRKWCSIGAAGYRTDTRIHVESIDNRPNGDWVVSRLAQLQRDHRSGPVLLHKSGPAGSLLAPLEAAGVAVEAVSTSDHAAACGAFYDGIVAQQVLHIGQPVLSTAALGAEKRQTADAWVWSRRSGVDIAPLNAVTLAAWGLNDPVAPDPAENVW